MQPKLLTTYTMPNLRIYKMFYEKGIKIWPLYYLVKNVRADFY